MISTIKKIIRRYLNKNVPTSSSNDLLKRNQLIKVADTSNIEDLQIEIRQKTDKCFVEIGNNCLLIGRFVLDRQESRIIVGDNTFIGGSTFISADEIYIGSNVLFSWGCTVIDTDGHSLYWEERKDDIIAWKKGLNENAIGKYKDWTRINTQKIFIKDKVWVGFNCVILKGITIGEGAVIGAGSVVTKDVPAYSLVAGNPAKIIKYLAPA